MVGIGLRRGWSVGRTAGVGLVCLGVPYAVLAVGLFWVLADARALALAQLANSWSGTERLAAAAGVPGPALDVGRGVVTFAVTRWWVLLPAVVAVAVLVGVFGATLALRPALRRIAPLLPRTTARELDEPTGRGRVVAPLPVRLAGVGVRYEGSARAALAGVDLSLERGRFLGVSGPNGAGKSTLGRILAGQAPTEGTVHRPGSAGLGAPGGTGVIFQRPESQVLGVRVVDDLLWGTDPGIDIDVDGLLARVGLAGFAERETSTLSGGELQRLAVAALIARRPAVVISDESTAMLDPRGRSDVVELLHGLVREDGATVVHISHHPDELTATDTLHLDAHEQTTTAAAAWRPMARVRGARVEVRNALLVHDAGTPWQQPALSGVDLDIPAGHTVLVTGPNGAGKSTLAWMLAGLLVPTRGSVTLDGRPLHNGRDGALLGIQHPRLALLRATVGEDVRDAAGADAATADAALAAVGLDPERFAHRAVHELSGGEQRRVVLAGLLTAQPRLLVLDEPLAGLDRAGRDAVRRALHALRRAGITLVVVTHDAAALDDLADATLTVDGGKVEGPYARAAPGPAAPTSVPRRRNRVRTVMRTLPGTSPAHRLWAGTKIGMLLAVAVVPVVDPSWPALGGSALVLAAWALAGRVPRGAWPRPPAWLLVWAGAGDRARRARQPAPAGVGAGVHRQPRRPQPGGAVLRDRPRVAGRRDDPGVDHAGQRHPPAAAQAHRVGRGGTAPAGELLRGDRPRPADGADAARRQPHDPAPRRPAPTQRAAPPRVLAGAAAPVHPRGVPRLCERGRTSRRDRRRRRRAGWDRVRRRARPTSRLARRAHRARGGGGPRRRDVAVKAEPGAVARVRIGEGG